MSLRTAKGRVLDWIDTSRESGFSNFDFVGEKYGADPVVRRIFSLARKQGFQSLLIEEITEANCPLLVEENEALAIRQADFKSGFVHRLSFLRCSRGQFDPVGSIGVAAIKFDSFGGHLRPRVHVFEAIFPPPRLATENNFIHCARKYSVATGEGSFDVQGVLYAQQNDLTSVCAHVALRTALSVLLPDGDISYARINHLAGIDHKNTITGEGRGLRPEQVESVLTGSGFLYDKTVHEPKSGFVLPTDYQRHVYGAIESGFPALLGFELADPAQSGNPGRHIIPVFGHTFNEDTWVAEAQRNYFGAGLSYYPSENWLSSFVAHDDNFGPYFCLPRNFLQKENFRLLLGLKALPTSFGAIEAESLGFAYAQRLADAFKDISLSWLAKFCVFCANGSLVLRVQIVRRGEYERHLENLETWGTQKLTDATIGTLVKNLPDYFWLAELSAPELFASSRRKFGELIIGANDPVPSDLSLLLAARLPGYALTRKDAKLTPAIAEIDSHTALFSRTL